MDTTELDRTNGVMAQIDAALGATHQAIVTFDDQSRVIFSTALADQLLGIHPNNGSLRVPGTGAATSASLRAAPASPAKGLEGWPSAVGLLVSHQPPAGLVPLL